MKKGYFFIFAFILFVSTLVAGVFLQSFRGHNQGEDIKIEWETGEEINLSHFVIERSSSPQSGFINIATIPAKGNDSYYSYLDESIFKQNEYVFYYRLKSIDDDGDFSHSYQITVSLNPSSVKKTWGSIKAMFR